MSDAKKAIKDGISSATGGFLGKLFGIGSSKPKRDYTLLLRLHVRADSKRDILTVFEKITKKAQAMEHEQGDAAGMAATFIKSFFGITEDVELLDDVDGEIKTGHI